MDYLGLLPTTSNRIAKYSELVAGGGIARSINSVAANTTLAAAVSTDYVYFASGTITLTLPTAIGNSNQYTIKNTGTGVISITTTSAQTIDGGAAPITITRQNNSLTFISNGTAWFLI